MLSSLLIGAAIVLGFLVVYFWGMERAADLLRRRLEDEAKVDRYWKYAFGAWTILVSLLFGLVSLMDFGQSISKLGPYVTGFGIIFGILILLDSPSKS